jgi:NADPH:quinone reductase-like Zn-dependent oxidoreductase
MVNIYGGGYAEKAVVDERATALKPAGIDHIHAAAIPLAGQTAWQGLFRHGGLKAGQTVLIHGGSGGVGHYAIQFAKAKGARVLTTVSTDNVRFVRELGTDLIIDYKKRQFEDEASNLDVVFDLIDGETRERSWKLLKKGGILVTTLTDPSQDKAKEHGVRATRYTVEEDGSELAEIAELVTSGKVKPHVQKTYPLRSAVDALASVEEGHSVGKIVMTVS